MTGDRQHLYLQLYSGEQFENLQSQSLGQRRNNIPYRRESFSSKHALIEFDSDFNLIDAGLVGGSSSGKSLSQLQVAMIRCK
jgi:lipopolysaccharide export system permease protein